MLTLRRVVFTAAFGVMLASCSGVYGPKGNDAGGIIPWHPENEDNAMLLHSSSAALGASMPSSPPLIGCLADT
jgi:hypothetical protein